MDLARWVNPFIGTGAGAADEGIGNAVGNTPPGAAFPFGMALWSPDTTTRAGGYRYDHTRVRGFSLAHFSGRGVSCYQDVPILPVAGPVSTSPGADWGAMALPFSHDLESASPGYYAVWLDGVIRVELTVTRRTGMGRFTFPAGDASLLINAGGSANGNREAGTQVDVVSPTLITGSASSGDCGGYFTYRVYFALQLERPFATFGTWNGAAITPHSVHSEGAASGAYATFREGGQIRVKAGLSFVSVENALANIEAENPGWDFDATAAAARAAWNQRLGSMRVRGGTDDQRTVFYTALYHAHMHPSTFSDANGDYLGFDNQVHNAGSAVQYHNFAGWDNYRTQMPLVALLAPEASDMMQSLVNDAQQDAGGGLPRWQHANTNSGGMIGDSQDVVIATAHAFGARNFDAHAALAAMDRGASRAGTTSGGQTVREGLEDYISLGYVSTNLWGSAARTLEYAIDDFAVAQFAAALGDRERHAYYLRRAQNWRNLFRGGYIVPRRADGKFIDNFESSTLDGFVEGSAAQYRWMIPFNLRGLFDLMGGNGIAIERLDRHFTRVNDGLASDYGFMGNEPSLKTPWAYAFAGAPWRTQELVRQILLKLYRNAPGGVPGNDDGGTLGAWAVFAAAGLFPQIPAVGGFVVGSPLFPHLSVTFANGSVLEIDAPEASDATPYVRGLKLNGGEHARCWIPWDAIAGGGTLEFVLGGAADKTWAAGAAAAPPSFDAP